MRSFQIVAGPTVPDDVPGVAIAAEQALVKACASQAPIEVLDKAILYRLARLDVMPSPDSGSSTLASTISTRSSACMLGPLKGVLLPGRPWGASRARLIVV